MADQDRPPAPDGDQSATESESDWFFRDRSDVGQSSQQPSSYYGPFGQQPPPAEDPTRVLPTYAAGYPPPAGAPQQPASSSSAPGPQVSAPSYPPPPPTVPPTSRPATTGGSARRPRTGLIVLLSVVLAALVGAAAGYGGARLAGSTGPTSAAPVPTIAPLPRPSKTDGGSQKSPEPAAPNQIDTVQVAATALPSTVMIRVGSGSSGGTGSGFVLDNDGHIMTNNHVIAEAADGGRITVVLTDGVRVDAKLVGRSPSYDLAVIKLTTDHELVPMAIGDSDNIKVGEPVVAIGSPLALASTVTQGIVSAKNRPVVVNSNAGADAASAYINGIQTDAAINPGNSGGPLVDANARVVGVNSAILTMGGSDAGGNIGLGFAIPINQAMVIGKQLITEGKATYPIIGVNVDNDSGGVRVSRVDAGGPAENAGLRVDDLITKIGDQPVETADELIVAIRTRRPGDKVTLTYQRGGQQQTAEVTLGSREG